MAHLKGLALVCGFDLVDQPFLGSFGDGVRPATAAASTAASADTPVPPGASPPAGGTPAGAAGGGVVRTESDADDLSWLWADDEATS
eukprot:scaffold54537_cov27-Tisochrysis_lutea.AAC.4